MMQQPPQDTTLTTPEPQPQQLALDEPQEQPGEEVPQLDAGASLEAKVEQALILLDESEVREYQQAVLTDPDLVQRECNVTHYLHSENGNILATAQRIARYWKARKNIFGDDRWLRPMNQTGRGTLTADDVEILRTAYICVVPNPMAGGVVVLVGHCVREGCWRRLPVTILIVAHEPRAGGAW